MKIYILRTGSKRRHFSSINNLAHWVIKDFYAKMNSHSDPQYFLHRWPNPMVSFRESLNRISVSDLDSGETEKEVSLDLLENILDEVIKSL